MGSLLPVFSWTYEDHWTDRWTMEGQIHIFLGIECQTGRHASQALGVIIADLLRSNESELDVEVNYDRKTRCLCPVCTQGGFLWCQAGSSNDLWWEWAWMDCSRPIPATVGYKKGCYRKGKGDQRGSSCIIEAFIGQPARRCSCAPARSARTPLCRLAMLRWCVSCGVFRRLDSGHHFRFLLSDSHYLTSYHHYCFMLVFEFSIGIVVCMCKTPPWITTEFYSWHHHWLMLNNLFIGTLVWSCEPSSSDHWVQMKSW